MNHYKNDKEHKKEHKKEIKTTGFDEAVNDPSVQLEIISRKLEKIDEDDPKMEELIAKRREIRKDMETRRLKRRLAELEEGEEGEEYMEIY
tara:strand:- start:10207 stop:10479 length:273 start_codon:yes stop_codon:yes gene_type:complete